MQDKYGMEKSNVTNCLIACFCPCCQLVQEEKESVVRSTGINPLTYERYVSPPSLIYSG